MENIEKNYYKSVRLVAKNLFNDFDVDKSGTISKEEFYISVLMIYNKLNQQVPVHVNPPPLSYVQKLHKQVDTNKDGQLSYPEFEKLIFKCVFRKDTWRESILVKFATGVLLKMVIFPFLAVYLKRFITFLIPISNLDAIPDWIFAVVIGSLGETYVVQQINVA